MREFGEVMPARLARGEKMTKDQANKKARRPALHSSLEFGRYETEAAKALQTEMLHAYAQLSRSWFARVQSEAALWADLGRKVATSLSLSEKIDAQKHFVSHQIQMTVEGGQHLLDDYEKIARQIRELVRSTTTTVNGESDIN